MEIYDINKEARKIKSLNEWSFLSNISEDEEEDTPQDGMPPEGGDQGGMPPMGDDQGGMSPDGGDQGGMPPMGDDQGGMSPDGGDQGGMPPIGDDQDGMPPIDGGAPDGVEDMEDEDEIDVTAITDAQEKMNKKINNIGKDINKNNVSSTMYKLMSMLDKMNDIISSNNSKIEDLKKELELRNPTPLEKLDLRSVDSSKPYNIRPNDYWNNKLEKMKNYTAYDERDPYSQEKKEQFVITNDDINNINNSEIEKTLSDFNIDINKIFGLN